MSAPAPHIGTARLVESPEHLWHIRNDGAARTLCGETGARDWPVVLHWDTRTGITCGLCLFAADLRPARARTPSARLDAQTGPDTATTSPAA